jgi:hypothetical protein
MGFEISGEATYRAAANIGDDIMVGDTVAYGDEIKVAIESGAKSVLNCSLILLNSKISAQ